MHERLLAVKRSDSKVLITHVHSAGIDFIFRIWKLLDHNGRPNVIQYHSATDITGAIVQFVVCKNEATE